MAKSESETTLPGETNKPTRLAELAGGIGHKIEDIKGQEVTVYGIEITVRKVRALKDEPEKGISQDDLVDREVAIFTADIGDGVENRYYTFSEPLINKVRDIAPSSLPTLAIFDLKDIGGGRRVWTIE